MRLRSVLGGLIAKAVAVLSSFDIRTDSAFEDKELGQLCIFENFFGKKKNQIILEIISYTSDQIAD